VSLGSDAEALAPEGVFMKSSTHPRAYGNFARLLGKYSRDEKLMPLEEAIRRITRLPAANWKLQDRGCLDANCYADVVVFDPATIAQGNLRLAEAVRRGRRTRAGQRRTRDSQWRAHGRQAGARRARAGISAVKPGCSRPTGLELITVD
jgi:N-acyl-D-aspartate/D-glutamate deacylase